MSEEVLTRKYVAARVTVEVWLQLDAIRKARKWSWQTFIEDIVLQYLDAYKRRQQGGGK